MAYTTKYRREFISRKTKKHFRIDVEEDGYAGSILEDSRNPVAPLKFVRDKNWPFFGTSIEFNLRSYTEYQFWDLYTANPRKYRTKVYENEKLVFIGYNIAETYSEPFRKTPYNVTLQAWDGLGLLKNVDWDVEFLGAMAADIPIDKTKMSYIKIISLILKYLGYGIDIHVAIPVYETNMSTSSCPTIQAFENMEKYEGNDYTAYDVLTYILNLFDAYVTQKDAAWYIVSSAAKYSTHNVYTYDEDGVADTSYTTNGPVLLGSSNDQIMAGPKATIEVVPQPKKVEITTNYELLDNLFSYSRFIASSFNNPGTITLKSLKNIIYHETNSIDNWSLTGNANIFKAWTSDDSTLFFGVASQASQGTVSFVSDNLALKAQNNLIIDFEVLKDTDLNNVIYIEIYHNGEYLTTSGWQGTQAYFDWDDFSDKVWVKQTIYTNITADGNFYFKVYISGSANVYTCFIRNLKIYFQSESEEGFTSSVITRETIQSQSSENTEEITLLAGDLPDYANKSLMYYSGIQLSDNSYTSAWKVLGETNTYNIDQLLALIVASKNRQPRIKFNAVLINFRYDNNMQILDENGDPILDENGTPIQYADLGINFESIIQIDVNGSRNFAIETGTHDAYNETYDVEMIELLSYEDTSS